MTRFKIPYPKTKAGKTDWSKRYGLNAIYAGKHHRERSADKAYWHSLIAAELKRQKIPKKPYDKPVAIIFRWNSHLDLDNHAYMRKMIIDGLRGHLIYDDTRRYVKRIEEGWHDENYILVEVIL